MPVGLLVTMILVGSCIVVAIAPLRRPRILAVLSVGLGLIVSELPQLAAGLVIAATVLAYAQGDLQGSGLLVASIIAALSVMGSAVLLSRGLRARAAVVIALRQNLPHAPIDVLAGRTRPTALRRTFRTLLTPYPGRPRGVVRVADLPYGAAGPGQHLDVYLRRTRPLAGPVLIYFHGGGYTNGDKHREAKALLYRLARHGWVCISANYRLRPTADFPDHLVDVKRVIAWAREHAGEYGADTSTLVVCGSSAGAHLAALAALSQSDPAFQPGFETADTHVTAAVCLYGYYGRYYGRGEFECPRSSPLAYDVADAPPFFLAHGDHDTQVPVESARAFARHLRSASTVPVAYVELPGGHHAFDLFRSLRFEAVVDGVEAFLQHVVPEWPAASPDLTQKFR